jgi:hypothetical protein
MILGLKMELVIIVFMVLLLFGIGYNALVAWLERSGYLRGFIWLAVAIGVGVTLTMIAILDWRAAILVFVGFAASGTPMAIGSISRYVMKRQDERRARMRMQARRMGRLFREDLDDAKEAASVCSDATG